MGCTSSSSSASATDAGPLPGTPQPQRRSNPLRLTPLIGPGASTADAPVEDVDRQRSWARGRVRDQVRERRRARREAHHSHHSRSVADALQQGSFVSPPWLVEQEGNAHVGGLQFVCFESRRASEAATTTGGGDAAPRLESSRRGADSYEEPDTININAGGAEPAAADETRDIGHEQTAGSAIHEGSGFEWGRPSGPPSVDTHGGSSAYLPDSFRTATGHRSLASDSVGPRSSGPATPITRFGSMARFHHPLHHSVVAGTIRSDPQDD